MVKARRGPFRLFQLRHGRGHVAPVPRPAVDSETVAAGAARGHGAGGRTREARRITQAGAASTSNITDADHGRAAEATLRDAAARRVPAARLSRPRLSAARVSAELPGAEHALAAGGAGVSSEAWISSARVPGRALWATDGAGARAGAFSKTVAVARAVSAAATAWRLRGNYLAHVRH